MNLETAQQQQITVSPGDKRNPAWGPEGRVAYQTSNHTLEWVQEGAAPSPWLAAWWPARDVAWSPDGSQVAFAKLRTDLVDQANVWVADAAGKEASMLTHEAGMQVSPAWSPDGVQMAYVGGQGYQHRDLYVVQARGGGLRQLTTDAAREFSPAWSPDGTRIAYGSDGTGDQEVWVIGADGASSTRLPTSPGLDAHPTWSSDGQHLAFTTNRSGRLEIWVMRADGAEQRLLVQGAEGVCDPAWR